MRKILLVGGWWWIGAVAFATPAFAQEADPPSSQSDTVEVAPPRWSATASAGLVGQNDGPDGSWQALSLSRIVGRGYLRAIMMRYRGTLTQADLALPSDYYVGTLAAGGNFDNWVVDGWASYGRQIYGRISSGQGSRASTGAKSSGYYAIGGDFGRVILLGRRFYLTPPSPPRSRMGGCCDPLLTMRRPAIWKPVSRRGRPAPPCASIAPSASRRSMTSDCPSRATGPATACPNCGRHPAPTPQLDRHSASTASTMPIAGLKRVRSPT